MRKVTNKNTPLEFKEGVLKNEDEIFHLTDEVVQFHANCVVTFLETDDPKHFALAFHHLAVLMDLQLNCLGFSLTTIDSGDLDKLSPRLRELTLKAQEWRHLPTLEIMPEMTKDLLNEYGLLLQETYNEEVHPLLEARTEAFERENESCANENLERSMKEILGRKLA